MKRKPKLKLHCPGLRLLDNLQILEGLLWRDKKRNYVGLRAGTATEAHALEDAIALAKAQAKEEQP